MKSTGRYRVVTELPVVHRRMVMLRRAGGVLQRLGAKKERGIHCVGGVRCHRTVFRMPVLRRRQVCVKQGERGGGATTYRYEGSPSPGTFRLAPIVSEGSFQKLDLCSYI